MHMLEGKYTVEAGVNGLARWSFPLAIGWPLIEIVTGRATPRDAIVSGLSYVATATAVNMFADAIIAPALFAVGPSGWFAAGLYMVGKAALSVYLGDRLHAWLHGLLDRADDRKSRGREGVVQKIDGLGASRPDPIEFFGSALRGLFEPRKP
jgi:hypothetical protein